MALISDQEYIERVYAGVLGKIIGVYVGRPLEGWSYERIMAEIGEIRYYVNDRLRFPLIVTDDDISGTFTFIRALEDAGRGADIPARDIGQSWLNYIIEGRTILWWGGLGNSTEHTAYLRLKAGIPAPQSGSIARNGKVVAEQIGAQIFIDSWAMVVPGDPEQAADLARRAASVSHDCEAIYGAQVLAAMESLAFVESDLNRLLDAAVRWIPRDCVIYRLIADLREWRAGEPDWRHAREKLVGAYGYDKYGGNCHIVPNHGVIHLALLYGDDDFSRSLTIANTAGWDTDCNSGNVGCLLGIKKGLAAFAGDRDWRGPVADRLYVSSADGRRAVTDALTVAARLANLSRSLQNLPTWRPKDGARFHFELPGSVQGFRSDESDRDGPLVRLANASRGSRHGRRSLALDFEGLSPDRPARVRTSTFMPPEAMQMPGYALIANPTLYPGQKVRLGVQLAAATQCPVTVRPYISRYDTQDTLIRIAGTAKRVSPGGYSELTWQVPETEGFPIAEVGIELGADQPCRGRLHLDFLTWDGTPDVTLTRTTGGTMWRRAWVDAVDQWEARWPEAYRLVQNQGTGLISQGGPDWTDYEATADVCPHMVQAAGLAVRVQGLRRYYALLVRRDGRVRLVKQLDGVRQLAWVDIGWEPGQRRCMRLQAEAGTLRAWIDDQHLFTVTDSSQPLLEGAVGLVCQEGRTASTFVHVRPLPRQPAAARLLNAFATGCGPR